MTTLGELGKAEGMSRVDEHASALWKLAADDAIWRAALELKELTTDDVVARIDDSYDTRDWRALGPAMMRAARAGWIVKANKPGRNARDRRHASPLLLWTSLIYKGNNPMPSHSSILGGSNAARLLACPASYQEQLKSPVVELDSPYAAEGTFLHEVVAWLMAKRGKQVAVDMLGMQIGDHTVDESHVETLDTAAGMLDDILRLYGDPKKFKIVGLETNLKLPVVTGAFGTVDLVMANSKTVVVVDWKFGQGVPVKALYEDLDGDTLNPQLAFYTAAARHHWPKVFADKQIVCAIIQPRLGNGTSFTETDDAELDRFLGAFEAAFTEALGRDAHREKGDHCRFAACKATCPLWTGPVFDIAMLDPTRVSEVSADDYGNYLSRAMDMVAVAEYWIEEIRKQTHALLADGGRVPGWKLVPKRATRQWVNESDVTTEKLYQIGADYRDVFSEPALRSVAQVEKEIKKRGLKIPENLYASVSSGTTIATVDDRRPDASPGQIVEDLHVALQALR